MSFANVRRIVLAPALAVAFALFVAGCDSKPSGVYQAEGAPGMTMEFKSGKVAFKISTPLGSESKESDYTVSGDQIKVAKDPDGQPVTMTLNKDGTITGPGGIKFVKQKS